jgi:hypothetical protein
VSNKSYIVTIRRLKAEISQGLYRVAAVAVVGAILAHERRNTYPESPIRYSRVTAPSGLAVRRVRQSGTGLETAVRFLPAEDGCETFVAAGIRKRQFSGAPATAVSCEPS